MSGQHLHDYDLDLCNYALGNVRPHLDDPGFTALVRGGLPARFEQYLWANLGGGEPECLILDDVELDALESLLDTPPALERYWVPDGTLHDRHVFCVREIRAELTRQDAEEWSRGCARFSRRLSADRLPLSAGVSVVRDWLGHLRRLLKAMEATRFLPYPDGCFPTPTTPTPLLIGPLNEAEGVGNSSASLSPMAPCGLAHGGQRDGLFDQILASVNEVRDLVMTQRRVRDYYSTEQAAELLGKSHWTVREWCRLRRVHAEKRNSGRGRSLDWVISHAELLRIEKEGLLAVPKY